MSPAVLAVILTNFVQTITIPIVPCRDNAIMSGYFHGDGTNMFGIRIEALDKFDQVVAASWVGEFYVPPMSETAVISLTPNVVKVKCSVVGPNPEKVFSNGLFELHLYQPPLKINRFDQYFIISWFDSENCYWLERNDGNGWYKTDQTKVPNIGNTFSIWRLDRSIQWRQ